MGIFQERKDAMKFFRTYDNVASKGKWKEFVDEMAFDSMVQERPTMAQEQRNMYSQGQLVRNTADGSRPGYGGIRIKLTSTHEKNILEWGKNKGDGEWSNERIFEEYEKSGGNRRSDIREGIQTGAKKNITKLSTKEVQALYKDLPDNISIQVVKRGKKKIPEYTFRAQVSGKNVGKERWTMDLKATPENKTKIIEETQKVLDEYHPNRLSREEYAELRLKPENKRLKGEDFAKKLNKAGYTTYAGDEWGKYNVYNYDKETPRSSKKLAKDLGFFEKRTVAEAKDIIKQYSGGKHFLKNKNLTDAQITTRAAEYMAMEKNIEKTGGTYSFPRGPQNKRKVWQNIYASHDQGGRFKLANADELPKFENGRINWREDKAWRKAKFKDSKSGKIFTYDNLEEMVDKHGGGWNKAVKAYDDNARLNQTTFKGKALNEWFREGMIKQEYEALIEKKVPWKDKGLQKYLGDKKPYYSFTEAHHFKGVKDHPFDTESSFRYANREQGYAQNSYNKAIKSGSPDRISKAKKTYIDKMNTISDDLGGIRYKMDDTRFVGAKGTEESIIRTGAKVSGMSESNQIKLFKQLGYRCRRAAGGEETVACYMSDVEKTRADMKSSDVTVRAKALTKQRKSLQLASKIPQLKKILKTGVQLGTAAITKPLQALGLTSGLGYAIEGLVEGGFYDNARRKGYSHEQAMAETFTPGLLAGRPEDVPWYGGSEKLREKELYTQTDPREFVYFDGKEFKNPNFGKPTGKIDSKVLQYVDALKEQDRIYEAIGAKEQAKKELELAETGFDATLLPGDLDAASADVQDLARSGAYRRVDKTLAPESMASQAYNTAVESQQALDQRRRREYLEKVEPAFLEREQKSFDTKRHREKRYREMKEKFPGYSDEEIDEILAYYETSPSEVGMSYGELGKMFDTGNKQAYYADNFRMEKAEGGIMSLKKKR